MPSAITCPRCHAPLPAPLGSFVTCAYCGATSSLGGVRAEDAAAAPATLSEPAYEDRVKAATATFDRVIAAGEDARAALAARSTPFHARLGRRCYAFARAADRAFFEGIGIDFVDTVAQADFLAVIGIDKPGQATAEREAELVQARARGLPMLCANPDLTRFHEGRLVPATGALARRYEELGGEVYYHGKPWPAIYDSCLAALPCARERVVAVGDSIEHDVLGARRAGLASAFVCGGIHAAELGVSGGGTPAPGVWLDFERRAPVRPDYRLAAFVW